MKRFVYYLKEFWHESVQRRKKLGCSNCLGQVRHLCPARSKTYNDWSWYFKRYFKWYFKWYFKRLLTCSNRWQECVHWRMAGLKRQLHIFLFWFLYFIIVQTWFFMATLILKVVPCFTSLNYISEKAVKWDGKDSTWTAMWPTKNCQRWKVAMQVKTPRAPSGFGNQLLIFPTNSFL